MATLLDDGHWRVDRNDDEGVERRDEGEQTEREASSRLAPEEMSLQQALCTRSFEGFEGKRLTYLYTTQLTSSNVMSTIVTSRPVDTSAKRRGKALSTLGTTSNSRSNQQETVSPGMMAYAQPVGNAPKKVKKKNGKYQAQLPSFQRSLPALPIPANRLNHELLQERDKFMKQLKQEREEKTRLDNWAATTIQACYRGFRARPRLITYEARQKLNTLSSIRIDLSDMEDALKQAAPVRDRVSDEPKESSPWRQGIASRAGRKRDFRARREQMQHAATKIQTIVKSYLARLAYARLLSRHYDEIYLFAVIKIQSVYRGYRLRVRIMAVVAKLQSQAAIQIQSLIRGIQARERVGTLWFEKKCKQLRCSGQSLQFTLPSRTKDITHTSCLRVLFEHHKRQLHKEFKSTKWHDERMLLRIYKVAIRLNVQRQWLLRLQTPLPTTRQRRKRPVPTLSRQASRLHTQRSHRDQGGLLSRPSTPTSPTTTRRRPPYPSLGSPAAAPTSLSPTSSRLASPNNWSARIKTPPT